MSIILIYYQFINCFYRYNEGKPVPNSRDAQEVPTDVGLQVLDFFEKFRNQTSILDDYEFYEIQERGKI